jgi:hypothetical protein
MIMVAGPGWGCSLPTQRASENPGSPVSENIHSETVWKIRIGLDMEWREWLKQGEMSHLALLSRYT